MCVCAMGYVGFGFLHAPRMMYASLEDTQKYACWNANEPKL